MLRFLRPLHERGGSHQIEICLAGTARRKRTLFHELAHAWLATPPRSNDQEAFLARRGLPGWIGPQFERESHGVEHAAEIIVWGLDERCEPSTWLPGLGNDNEVLADEFEHLTHEKPLCIAHP